MTEIFATVARHEIPVVALLVGGIDDAVAADVECAVVLARVGLYAVSIIALFASVAKAVAAQILGPAGSRAPIVTAVVPIVALLNAGIDEPITTYVQCAVGLAGVGVAGVSIIALLAAVDGSIAAQALELAGGRTTVATDVVGVVALLAGAHVAVTAARYTADRAATIAADSIPIVARFAEINYAVRAEPFGICRAE